MRIKVFGDPFAAGLKLPADTMVFRSDVRGVLLEFLRDGKCVATLADAGIRLEHGDVLTVRGIDIQLDVGIIS